MHDTPFEHFAAAHGDMRHGRRPGPGEVTSVVRTSNRMPLADAFTGMRHFSIELDYLLRDSAAGLSIDFMNRDALFGDPLANDRVVYRASANRAYSRSVRLTWI